MSVLFEFNGDGNRSVASAGTAVKLADTSIPVERVDVVANFNNTGVIVIGSGTVVANSSGRRGVPLEAGDAYCIEIPTDLNQVYIDATISGEGVTFTWWRGKLT